MKATIVLETDGNKNELRLLADNVQRLLDESDFNIDMVYMEERE